MHIDKINTGCDGCSGWCVTSCTSTCIGSCMGANTSTYKLQCSNTVKPEKFETVLKKEQNKLHNE